MSSSEKPRPSKKLAAKKAEVGHGNWLPWLEENAAELGFGDRTANLLMKAATNPQLAANLTESSALEISRQLWGHKAEPKLEAQAKPESRRKPEAILDDVETLRIHGVTEVAAVIAALNVTKRPAVASLGGPR